MTNPASDLLAAIQEAGAIVDGAANASKRLRAHSVHTLLKDLGSRSEQHSRVCTREEYAVGSDLQLPQERALGSWPFGNPLFARPLGNRRVANDTLFVGPEAHQQYAMRARTSPKPGLAARYADLAWLTGSGNTRREFATL